MSRHTERRHIEIVYSLIDELWSIAVNQLSKHTFDSVTSIKWNGKIKAAARSDSYLTCVCMWVCAFFLLYACRLMNHAHLKSSHALTTTTTAMGARQRQNTRWTYIQSFRGTGMMLSLNWITITSRREIYTMLFISWTWEQAISTIYQKAIITSLVLSVKICFKCK